MAGDTLSNNLSMAEADMADSSNMEANSNMGSRHTDNPSMEEDTRHKATEEVLAMDRVLDTALDLAMDMEEAINNSNHPGDKDLEQLVVQH